jgi:hypothetical protein
MGHLGGFLAGLLISLVLVTRKKRTKIIGIGLAIVFYVGGLVMFYTLRHPRPI